MHQVQHSFFKCIYISLKSLSVSFLSFSIFFSSLSLLWTDDCWCLGKVINLSIFHGRINLLFLSLPPTPPSTPSHYLFACPLPLNGPLAVEFWPSLSLLSPSSAVSLLSTWISQFKGKFFFYTISILKHERRNILAKLLNWFMDVNFFILTRLPSSFHKILNFLHKLFLKVDARVAATPVTSLVPDDWAWSLFHDGFEKHAQAGDA